MTALRQEAYQLLEELDESEMTRVIMLLKRYRHSEDQNQDESEGLEGLRIIESFAGRLPKDFDEKEELEKELRKKYGDFS